MVWAHVKVVKFASTNWTLIRFDLNNNSPIGWCEGKKPELL